MGSDELKVYLLKQPLTRNGLFKTVQGKIFVAFPWTTLSAPVDLQLNKGGHIKPSGCQSHTTQLQGREILHASTLEKRKQKKKLQ